MPKNKARVAWNGRGNAHASADAQSKFDADANASDKIHGSDTCITHGHGDGSETRSGNQVENGIRDGTGVAPQGVAWHDAKRAML